jgi:hypothetical protein
VIDIMYASLQLMWNELGVRGGESVRSWVGCLVREVCGVRLAELR